jgi:hypothetical protein
MRCRNSRLGQRAKYVPLDHAMAFERALSAAGPMAASTLGGTRPEPAIPRPAVRRFDAFVVRGVGFPRSA